MGLLIGFLLIASVLLTFIWIDKNNQDYLSQHQALHDEDLSQMHLIRDMLSNRLELWFESFIHLHEDITDNPQATANFINEEFDYLQLNWQVKDLWLLDSEHKIIFANHQHVPEYVTASAQQTLQNQSSTSNILCAQSCFQLISMPILAANGELLVLPASTSLLEMMAALNRSTLAELALVANIHSLELSSLRDAQIQPPISNIRHQELSALLKLIPGGITFDMVLDKGYRLVVNEQAYLINLLPVDEKVTDPAYLLAVHDISDEWARHGSYQFGVMIISAITVALCILTFFLMAERLRRRLLIVAKRLPLLAQKKYDEFNAMQFPHSRLFLDEIDEVQRSSNLLGEQLESMDVKIEQNTRELENIAMYDRLTGLPNRNMLNFVLRKKIASLARNPEPLVVILLDFDNFRKINDSYGHGIGDEFLIIVAQRLRSNLRESDVISRFGGDEFVIVLQEVDEVSNAMTLAEKLVTKFREPIEIGAQRFYTSVSLGITSCDEQNLTVDDLVRQADIAMYASKDAGGDRFTLFNEGMSTRVMRHIEIEHDIRDALQQEQFKFALQAQIDIDSGKLVGFEALIRWLHPKNGYIMPDEFIPIMENSESMITLGYWGIKRAFAILAHLESMGLSGLRVAVNLSASQFLDPNLINFMREQLAKSEQGAEQIELELTERTVVADISHTLRIMHQLKELGFSFSIDDFGTGYSSLAYLSQLPVDIIKIDRSFISGMSANSADKQIVKSTIAMVRKLGMKVVAEGVETAEQLHTLGDMHCNIAQGYYISKPLLEDDLYQKLPSKIKEGVWKNFDLSF
ncbi:MAG: GGDEF-domain containing protein [Alteromonadaceae bacterium]|nr:GGDEF-domain containing protein [Alteromonadaceae bacterium]